MKIRNQLTQSFGFVTLVILIAILGLNYVMVRNSLVKKALEDLGKIEQNMHRSSQALLSTAINGYLRGIMEANLEIIRERYSDFQAGKLTEQQAKDAVQAHFNLQKVGNSGYLVAVEEKKSRFYLDIHPFLRGSECTDTSGCKKWDTIRNGYAEYDWKNPKDNSYKKKAAYISEFRPWNWIVGASSYRDEFINLIKLEDLKKLLKPVKINDSGYFFVFDNDYRVLIHPEIEGADGRTLLDDNGQMILKLLRESEDGFLTYKWKNPSETKKRLKYALIDNLTGYNWFLVASGYYDEIFEPIERLKKITLGLLFLAGAVLTLIIFKLSQNITRPLIVLERAVNQFYKTKKPIAWSSHSITEIDVLGKAFSRMTDELNRSMQSLQDKVVELAISEQEKEESRNLLGGIIDSMPSVIITIDSRMRVNQWNREAEKISNRSQQDVQGKSLSEVFPQLCEHMDIISKSIAKNCLQHVTFEYNRSSGETVVFDMTVYPLVTEGDSGAVIRVDEVTDRVEMEQQLRQSQKMDAVGQLAGGIAHDFNNMLGGIMGAADLLREKNEPANQPLIKIIASATERASELVLKLLAFSRKDKVSFVPVDMHIVVKDTVGILSRTLDKKISISMALNAEHHTIMGDWSQLQNGLLNIGINGGHAMPDGGILSFSTRVLKLDQLACDQSPFALTPGWYLQIIVRDSGCGIPEEHQKRIFEPFFTTRKEGKGTGLGLAAVYGTVVQHKGGISLFSRINHGSEFHLLFPLQSDIHAKVGSQEASIISGDGCILVIDDEPIVRTAARLMLERLGYEILEAHNGQEGVEIYSMHHKKIKLVLLDMIMPVMDGTECFGTLRKINPSARIIISSGFSRDADLDDLKQQGLCDFIRKPYNISELSKAVARAIE